MKYAIAPVRFKLFVLNFSVITFAFFILIAPEFALASVGGRDGLPDESWLMSFINSVIGRIAITLSILTITIVMMFGSELNTVFKTLIFIVMVMALLIYAQHIMPNLFADAVTTPPTEESLLTPSESSIRNFK